jgi:hypothetical protein
MAYGRLRALKGTDVQLDRAQTPGEIPMTANPANAQKQLSRFILGALTGVVLVVNSSAAFAQGTAQQRAACTPDAFRLCSSEIPNVERIIACMRAKKASLSPACKAVFDKTASNG